MEIRNFKYTVTDFNGKLIKGQMEAINRAFCVKYLIAKNYQVKSVVEYNDIMTKLNAITIGSIMPAKQLVFFLKQLGALLASGITLLNSLELLSLQQDKGIVRRLYFELYQYVYSGYTLSKAMAQRPQEYPELLVQMVEIGELSGELAKTILDVAKYYENQQRISSQIQGAVRMPIIYLVAAVLIAAGMLIFVFPNITELYAAFGDAELPAITQFFINMGEFSVTYSIPILILLVSSIAGLILANRYLPKFRMKFAEFVINIPIFGGLIQMENQILIANSLAQMLTSGVLVTRALHSIKGFVKNVVYKDVVIKALDYVEEGKPLSKAFDESSYIDPIMSRMMATGEKSSEVPRLLRNLSEYYNSVTDIRVEQIKAAVQPILLILVYILVTIMILAVMLPMISLGEQVQS